MKYPAIVTLAITCIATASAATPFDEAVAEILSNNPTLQASRSRMLGQMEQTLGENTLEPLEVDFSRVWGADNVGNKWSLSVSQSFDWPGVYSARREAARAMRTAWEYTFESDMIDKRMEVRNALIDLIHNSQLMAVQRRIVAHIEELTETYRKGVANGDETRLDLNRAVIELVAAKGELNSLQSTRHTLIETLEALNGGKDVERIVASVGENYPVFEAVDPDRLTAEVISSRDPAIAAAEAAAKAANSSAKVERRLSLPGFKVGFEHETEMDEHFNGFSVGLSLPVWGARRHQRKGAMFEAEASLTEARVAVAQRVTQLNSALARLVTLRATLDEYEPVVNTNDNIALLDKAFAARQINALTYMQELTYFLEANKTYLDTLYEYYLTLSTLKRYE